MQRDEARTAELGALKAQVKTLEDANAVLGQKASGVSIYLCVRKLRLWRLRHGADI
jgi:hypothetical protein